MLPGHCRAEPFQTPYELGVVTLILQARGLWLRKVKGPASVCTARGRSWASTQDGPTAHSLQKLLLPSRAGLGASAQLPVLAILIEIIAIIQRAFSVSGVVLG